MDENQTAELVRYVLYGILGISFLIGLVQFIILEYRGYKTRNAPVYTQRATAHYKHSETDAPYLGRGYSYVYYITFHTDLGEALKLYMDKNDFYRIREGEAGQLTWQGSKFWKFIPEDK